MNRDEMVKEIKAIGSEAEKLKGKIKIDSLNTEFFELVNKPEKYNIEWEIQLISELKKMETECEYLRRRCDGIILDIENESACLKMLSDDLSKWCNIPCDVSEVTGPINVNQQVIQLFYQKLKEKYKNNTGIKLAVGGSVAVANRKSFFENSLDTQDKKLAEMMNIFLRFIHLDGTLQKVLVIQKKLLRQDF